MPAKKYDIHQQIFNEKVLPRINKIRENTEEKYMTKNQIFSFIIFVSIKSHFKTNPKIEEQNLL